VDLRLTQEGEADARKRELGERCNGRGDTGLADRVRDRQRVDGDEHDEAEPRPPIPDAAHAHGDEAVRLCLRN
jgi:hypothetical protein